MSQINISSAFLFFFCLKNPLHLDIIDCPPQAKRVNKYLEYTGCHWHYHFLSSTPTRKWFFWYKLLDPIIVLLVLHNLYMHAYLHCLK